MTSKYKKYSSYKDSGVEWLGEIPEHWDIRRFKTLFNEINERNKDSKGELLSVSQYTGVTKKSNNIEDGDLLSRASSLDDYKKVYKNDLVTNIMLAWNGSLGFSPFDGITSPAYSVYRLKKGNDTRFFHYLVRTEIYKSVFKRNSTGVIESRLRLYTDDFYNISSILPPLQEQTAIANFLDNKTSKIDTAIAQKQKMIALLKERKQIVIQNAVTGKWSMVNGKWGETPKEKMKDSGVEWLREIPEGWEVKRIKHLYKIGRGRVIAQTELIDGAPFPVYSSQTKDDGILGYINAYDFDCEQITWTTDGANAGTIFIRKGKHNCTNVCGTLQANSKSIINKFNKYALEVSSPHYKRPDTNGAKIMNNEMAEIFIVQPTLEEQTAIATFLDDKTSKIDTAITLQQTQIEKLKEYKATLIDSAVTGKIRVSD